MSRWNNSESPVADPIPTGNHVCDSVGMAPFPLSVVPSHTHAAWQPARERKSEGARLPPRFGLASLFVSAGAIASVPSA